MTERILFTAVIIFALVVVFTMGEPSVRLRGRRKPTPEELLKRRYVRGEIDRNEYQQRLDQLK